MSRNAFGLSRCPDCTATMSEDKRLVHDGACPLGRHLDEMTAADAAWFAVRPGESIRRRPVGWSEAWSVRAVHGLPDDLELRGDVVIRQVAPGVRLRSFHEVYALAPTKGAA